MSAAADPGKDHSGLRFVHDFEPGLGRLRSGAGFVYQDENGSVVNDPEVLERVRALAIPPAWTMVWIAPRSDAHLQATGIDRRGRKQYLYHPDWRHERDEVKFRDMEAFARAQPRLRRRIEAALAAAGEPLGHLRVLSLSLRLLDIGLLRVGSDRYARDNKHYGLTTLLREQVTVRPDQAIFDYVGKSGKRQRLAIADASALEVLGALKRRRGDPPELLVFRAPHGWSRIHREDVNNFLRREARGPFSAKEYRTWNATVVAAAALAAQRPRLSSAAAVASRAVADVLGNTPTVARQSYIDPRVLARFNDGLVISLDRLPADAWRARGLIERRVLAMLADSGPSGRPRQAHLRDVA
jgi:DNA topoisomerase IB